jgi:chromosome segregation ATPase
MQDKLKYIIFGLAAFIVLIVMMFLGLKVKSLERERNDLQNQNTSLNQQVSAITADNGNLKKKIDAVSKSLDETVAQRNDVQNKFNMLSQERDGLVNQINQIKAEKDKLVQGTGAANQSLPQAPSMDDAYFADILKQKAELEVQVSMMRDALKGLKASNDQLIQDKNNLSFEVNNLSRDAQDVQHTAVYNQKMVDTLTQELAREKTDKLEIAKRLKAIKGDNRQLRQQLQSLGERRLSLEKKLSDMQSKNAALESSLASMELYVKQQMFQMDDIKNQMEDTRTSVKGVSDRNPRIAPAAQQQGTNSPRRETIQLPPIVVRPQQGAPASGPNITEQSRIISIDKENNFVVVNVGSGANVKIGDTFGVYRDGQPVGSVEVIQARERIAACDIKNESTPLRVGDLIR